MRIERQVLFWLIAAALILAGIALLQEVLLPFVTGVVIAYFLNPVVDHLQRLGVSRWIGAALIILIGAILAAVALVMLVPAVLNQLRQLALSIPDDLDRVRQFIEVWLDARFGEHAGAVKDGLRRAMSQLSQNWSALVATLAATLWKQGMALLNVLSVLLVTPVVIYYLLVDWHSMIAKIDGWLPRDHTLTIRRLGREIDTAIAAFIRGQGTICLIMGAYYATALSLAGVPYGLLIGLLTGLFGFIPYAGWALGGIVAGIAALIQSPGDMVLLAIVAGIFGVGGVLDNAILAPAIVGPSIGLHPVWLIFALLVFSYLFGFLGVLLAVPIAAGVGVLTRFALGRYLDSAIYRGTQPLPPTLG